MINTFGKNSNSRSIGKLSLQEIIYQLKSSSYVHESSPSFFELYFPSLSGLEHTYTIKKETSFTFTSFPVYLFAFGLFPKYVGKYFPDGVPEASFFDGFRTG